ncbi:hypothetical protein [Mycolicibacterium sp. XJ870]
MTVTNETKTDTTEYASRRTIRAHRAGSYVLIVAEGDLPTRGYDADIEQNPIRIFPPHYDVLQRERPGIWPQVVVPYTRAEFVPYPEDQPVITVHHADGQDEVKIEGPRAGVNQFAALAARQFSVRHGRRGDRNIAESQLRRGVPRGRGESAAPRTDAPR